MIEFILTTTQDNLEIDPISPLIGDRLWGQTEFWFVPYCYLSSGAGVGKEAKSEMEKRD